MADFESWNAYYDFANFVRNKARHVMDAKRQAFLSAVVRTAEKRKTLLKKGTVLWRAQLGNEVGPHSITDEEGTEIDVVDMPEPLNPKRMTPLSDRAYEGRVNPKGIPCLYFSDDLDTAMTEVRPWIGSHVSVAQFAILGDLILVDCSSDTKSPDFRFVNGGEPDPANREQDVWWSINQAFSEPVTRTDDVADYAPTQVLAEAFRSEGCGGLVYGSKLGKGRSIAVFDIAAAELANCHLYQVEAVNLKFSMAANPYYVQKDLE